MPSTSMCAAFMSYDPVAIEKSPAGNFDGLAAASAAPWSASVFTCIPVILPSLSAARRQVMW
jgi:hypothetical protein